MTASLLRASRALIIAAAPSLLACAAFAATPAPTTKPKATTTHAATPTHAHTAPHAATGTSTTAAKKSGAVSIAPPQLAHTVASLEELGSYSQAADQLGVLRQLISPDADLDLWLAIDLARAGHADSAARILRTPLLEAALHDTVDTRRFRVYGWGHDGLFLDGHYTGWYWYVARARAEVAASLGRWDDALASSRVCTRARPLAGMEWYLRALFAARTGQADEAADASDRALRLAPSLPEAHYLGGLLAWRAGRRSAAQQQFRAAIELDSTYRAPALALVRARLPVAADTLPAQLLNGLREAELLTSGVQPKFDEFGQMDTPASIAHQDSVVIPDSLADRVRPFTVHPIALVDANGRVAMHEDPWTRAGSTPDEVVGMVSETLRRWRFNPAMHLGRFEPLWLDIEVPVVRPANASRATR